MYNFFGKFLWKALWPHYEYNVCFLQSYYHVYSFYHEELDKIIAEYSEKNEDGSPKVLEDGSGIKIKEEFVEEAKTKAEELWNLDVDSPEVQISLNDLDNIRLSIEELNAMSPFIKEE